MTRNGCLGPSDPLVVLAAAMEPGRNDQEWPGVPARVRYKIRPAAMEPGRNDQEWPAVDTPDRPREDEPQWSLVVMTRNGSSMASSARADILPQWSLVVMTRNGIDAFLTRRDGIPAAMEPGRNDQEWFRGVPTTESYLMPQWSLVVMTRNGRSSDEHPRVRLHAAMEPGRNDQEWPPKRLRSPSRGCRRNGAWS